MVKWLCGNSLGYYKERLSSFNHCCCLPFFRLLLFVRNLIVWNKLGDLWINSATWQDNFRAVMQYIDRKSSRSNRFTKVCKKKTFMYLIIQGKSCFIRYSIPLFQDKWEKRKNTEKKELFHQSIDMGISRGKNLNHQNVARYKKLMLSNPIYLFSISFFSFFFGEKKKEKLYG